MSFFLVVLSFLLDGLLIAGAAERLVLLGLTQHHPAVVLDTCPHCGSHNIDKLQRITGYLVGTTSRWNAAKLAELNDRIVHK